MILYVDTSAAMKLVIEELESAALVEFLEQCREGGNTLVASWLLHTELRRAAKRPRENYLSGVVRTFGPHQVVSPYGRSGSFPTGANRHPDNISLEAVSEVLSAVDLVDVERADLMTAPLLPGRLRSADAIHLATALRVGAAEMVAYDAELVAAAGMAGLVSRSPG